ncbi:hypothetical protein GCM10022289_05260 [Pedobacter jeongneungensis]|uniref:Uncharacterized protein n=1 Tax=Pedobacter jeongneungensis TaxID=947309 RepID=A0ABP8B4F7_9SPHI
MIASRKDCFVVPPRNDDLSKSVNGRYEASAGYETDASYLSMTASQKDWRAWQGCGCRWKIDVRFQKN